MADPIRIQGLEEFNDQLRELEKNIPGIIRRVSEKFSDDVRSFAQSRIPRQSGRARKSIKVETKSNIVRVVGGSPRVPYYGWLEFGGTVGVGGDSVRRKWERKGRYIYEGYFQKKNQLPEIMEAILSEGVEEAF